MKILKEFRDFAIKGNVIDLSTAVIIGTAFGKIVSSLVADIIMPIIAVVVPGGDWRAAERVIGPLKFLVGDYVGAIIDFVIVAFAIFLMIRAINSLKKKEVAAPAAPPRQEVLLTEIRDLLKK